MQLPRWWSGAHTYSGDAANLSLDAQAGGCWCERWGDGNSVQHGQVVLVQPGRTLRVVANLGPLQELPVNGVLTFTIAMQETKTILRLTYRVSGAPDAGLDKLAPAGRPGDRAAVQAPEVARRDRQTRVSAARRVTNCRRAGHM